MVKRLTAAEMSKLLPLPQAVFQILVALADQDRHGYAIMQDVVARTGGVLRLSPGTLYGSIKRMLEDGLIVEVDDRPSPDEDDERRRYYRITPVWTRHREGRSRSADGVAAPGARRRLGAEARLGRCVT